MKKKCSAIKIKLIEICDDEISQKIKFIEDQVLALKKSLLSETKSSAGDKHETGRAMIHLEQEKLSNQLSEYQKMRLGFNRIDPGKICNKSGLGSLISTSNGTFFISVSLGKKLVEGENIWTVSPNSPIGKMLIDKKQEESFTFNERKYTILSID